jgi:DNA-binding XRE family transcriptional regulator
VGVTIQTISNIEREGYSPKLNVGQFSKLCSLFELDIHELAALWEIGL